MAQYYYEYLSVEGNDLFTVVLLPEENGRFPTVINRCPYVKGMVNTPEDEIVERYKTEFSTWLKRGYAIIYQHCRGQGKSNGAFIPYINEREDGLELRKWIRRQSFYNGELYLLGASYTASLHYATAPFEKDIKGCVFQVQDSERYRLWYRNAQMRRGHANWHFSLYKDKCALKKSFGASSFSRLPLKDLSESALGERADDFEQMLEAYHPTHPFWNTRFGGVDAKDAVTDADIPILLTTGYNDFYVGGVFKMWEKMSKSTKEKSALLVSPYNHGDSYYKDSGIPFPTGQIREAFGNYYSIDWFDNIRKGSPLPFKKNVISYYRTFENVWQSDFHNPPTTDLVLPLGEGSVAFSYDPTHPPAFNCDGMAAETIEREDTVTVYTPPFKKDTFVKGQMKARLSVSSNCPDTSFYVRISIKKGDYTYVLRHDITSLCYQLGNYIEGERASIDFAFDEYAFLIKEGEQLRLDISSSDSNGYVCHTNKKGSYHLQTQSVTAENKVYLDDSFLILPTEN